jgi:PEP-CTERM motif
MKFCVIVAAALLAAAGAQAEPTSAAIGMVRILGTEYDVSLLYDSGRHFALQSFDELSPTVTFTTQADATAAAEALRDAFGARFDWHPAAAADFNGTRIVFALDDTRYDYVTVSGCCGRSNVFGPFSRGRGDANYYSFAQFALAVPEPEACAMMLLGLAAVGMASRRRQG